MEPNTEGNLLEIMDLARTLRQEQLFIQHEQSAFANLTETLAMNSTLITKLAYICAQQRQNLNDLIISRREASPLVCCRRANNFENAKFVDAKKMLEYEHVIAYEELFNHLYRSPYLLALSLSTGDRIPEVTPKHISAVIHTITAGLFGNAINTKDVEMILKLLRELIEIQIVVSDNPRRLLGANSSSFARLYHRLNESMFSAKIFLTAALFDPIMKVLVDSETPLDVDPNKVIQNFTIKERFRRFGEENSNEYQANLRQFHTETISKLHSLAKAFIDNLTSNWSLFPSTLRWLVQTMCHHLKQARFSDQIINQVITDMVFTYFICPAIVSPDIIGIIDAPISEQVRFNLIQIGQIIQMLALAKHDEVDAKFAEVHAKFECNLVTNLIDLLLVSRSGEDVVAILSQQSDFERAHLLSTQSELTYFVQFFQILMSSDEYDVPSDDRQKLKKVLGHLPDTSEESRRLANGADSGAVGGSDSHSHGKERSKQSFISLGKATKSKIAKSFSTNGSNHTENNNVNGNALSNGNQAGGQAILTDASNTSATNTPNSSTNASPTRMQSLNDTCENEPILVFNIYNSDETKLQPLTEEEVLKMNSIGQEISNDEAVLGADAESCNLENTIDKSSVANGFDGIDGMSDEVLRPLHAKQTRFSISHDDASIGNSDILEAVSEAPSNHSVTSSLELEENDQNDNLSDMVSANVSGRGTPNISGRDTPSSQVTDGESVNNVLPTPQMQKLLSKARSDIEDKFCKFEIKKLIEGDETVSIISDTWSTDVLASDSETLEASERERDRNFSTPLIPSAVVLPGDNNFDVLSASGAGRAAYLDASDQRSESNWSTDVLASDSEKLTEIDTDDNLSITARSDITDTGGRSEAERDPLGRRRDNTVAPNRRTGRRSDTEDRPQRMPELPFFAARGEGQNYHTSESPGYGGTAAEGAPTRDDSPGASGGENGSDRSQEDSAFFDAVNSYEDGSAVMGSASNHSGDDAAGINLTSAASLHYQGLSSLARSSVRTSSQFMGENNFQQNYKSSQNSNNNRDKDAFLSTPCMRRQTSAESSISNQSANLENSSAAAKPPPKNHHKGAMKKKKNNNNNHNTPTKSSQTKNESECKDLIDFSDFGQTEPLRSMAEGFSIEQPVDIFSVEHRRISSEQRSAGFDGRRNGIMAMKGGSEISTSSMSSLRRHQSLNYENHEIMINTSISTRVSAMPNLKTHPHTDDFKNDQQQQENLIVEKTENLQLNDNTSDISNGIPSTEPSITSTNNTMNSSSGIDVSIPNTSNHKPMKSTGAIPKSISFDASADKNSISNASRPISHRSQRMNESLPSSLRHSSSTAAGNSGIFNKLKQGFFKHRRSNKSRHSTTNTTADEFVSQSARSVSFSNNAPEVSLDLFNGPSYATASSEARNGATAATFCDISEDILAKYRRKVSTSSEATNSDSTGNSCHVTRKDSDADARVPGTNQHDKTIAFNVIKKKIRTVLSKTDLHTGDFRHTTYSNASPLLTYLQIQLAQAMNLQNFQQISYVSEAIRCLASLETSQHQQLLEELQTDIQKRQNYLQYLMRYRQNLLLIMENVEQFESRLRSESSTCNRYLMAICVRLFLEKRESKIVSFQEEFSRLTVSDDKIDLIEEFIDGLMEEILAAGGILHGMSEWQVQEARISLERILLQRMYHKVMFPNEDADLSRDTVLFEHIRKLQKIIRPSHPALCIPQEYLAEAPWTFAQQQLSYISAYNTPREKLQCVIRCISSIMSLLHMSSGRVPAADDLLPVLIYVVIMANPPYLLSTVEYITCFIGEKLDGEEEFHWTIFGSVVKFIKTMDYLD